MIKSLIFSLGILLISLVGRSGVVETGSIEVAISESVGSNQSGVNDNVAPSSVVPVATGTPTDQENTTVITLDVSASETNTPVPAGQEISTTQTDNVLPETFIASTHYAPFAPNLQSACKAAVEYSSLPEHVARWVYDLNRPNGSAIFRMV